MERDLFDTASSKSRLLGRMYEDVVRIPELPRINRGNNITHNTQTTTAPPPPTTTTTTNNNNNNTTTTTNNNNNNNAATNKTTIHNDYTNTSLESKGCASVGRPVLRSGATFRGHSKRGLSKSTYNVLVQGLLNFC